MRAQDVTIDVSSSIGSDAAEYARERVAKALTRCAEPILSARVRVTRHRDPAVARPVVVQVNVDVNGRPVMVESTGTTSHEAIDLVEDKLARRLSSGSWRRQPWRVFRRRAAR